MQGNSVCCHVHGFHPYFFVPAPEKFNKENLRDFRMALNNVVVSDMKNNRDNITDAVLHVEILQKSTIYHFQGSLLKDIDNKTVRRQGISISSQKDWLPNGYFKTTSDNFFALYLKIFHKTEAQTVILRCKIGSKS